MKLRIIYVLLMLTQYSSMGQCLTNGDFADFCGVQTGTCPTFDTPCLTGWKRSHGTPEVFSGGPNLTDNVVYMWSTLGLFGQLAGEGIFQDFPLVAGQHYLLKIRFQATTTGDGFVRVYASNGIRETARPGTCGSNAPPLTGRERILDVRDINFGWVTYTVPYTPSGNFSQVLVYPASNTLDVQIDVLVDYVFICLDSCAGNIVYNSGVVPTGITKKSNITAGGGTTPVTVSPTAATYLQGTSEVRLLPEFQASVTSGQFLCEIVNCSGSESREAERTNIAMSQIRSIDHAITKKDVIDNIRVLSNPVQNRIEIQLFQTDKSKIDLTLVNSVGTVVRKINTSSNTNNISVDMSGLPGGIYFLQCVSKKGKVVKKIQKL